MLEPGSWQVEAGCREGQEPPLKESKGGRVLGAAGHTGATGSVLG